MQVQINSGSSVVITEKLINWARSEVEAGLGHFEGKITRVDVYLADLNGNKGGEFDKHCAIEARLGGMRPLAVSHDSASLDSALGGAIDKLEKVLDHEVGKINHKKGSTPFGGEPFADLRSNEDELGNDENSNTVKD